jgi:hypothetical protein
MKRIFLLSAVVLMAAGLLASALTVQASTNRQDAPSGTADQAGPDVQLLPPDANGAAPNWWPVPPLKRFVPWNGPFKNYLGSEVRFIDKDDNRAVAEAHPGVVIKVGEWALAIERNDGTGVQTFDFGDEPPAHVKRVLSAIEPGAKVVVVTLNGDPRTILTARRHPPRPRTNDGDGSDGPRPRPHLEGNEADGVDVEALRDRVNERIAELRDAATGA